MRPKVKVKLVNPARCQQMNLPAQDRHFSDVEYQKKQQDFAYALCDSRRRAIDAGAHVGYWSKNMVKLFASVDAFEPDIGNQRCFKFNVRGATLHPIALGAKKGYCTVVIDEITNSGAKHVELQPTGIRVQPLDAFGFTDVDLIKIDTQGFELPILRGAVATIKASHPVLVVEMPKRTGDPGIEQFLADLGYRVAERFLADWIYVMSL